MYCIKIFRPSTGIWYDDILTVDVKRQEAATLGVVIVTPLVENEYVEHSIWLYGYIKALLDKNLSTKP